MSGKSLAGVAFKVLGVYLFVVIVTQIISFAAVGPFGASLGAFVAMWSVEAVVATFLILYGDTIAWILIGESENLQVGITSKELLWIGFAVVGLMTLLSGLEDIAQLLLFLAQTHEEWRGRGAIAHLRDSRPQLLLGGLFQTSAGILLMINRERWLALRAWFVRSWFTMRSRDPDES